MKPKQPFWASSLVAIFFILGCSTARADTSTVLNPRQKGVWTGLSAAYTGGFTGLYFLWYADYNSGQFHFFDDNNEWGQMDKVGHVYSAYAESKYASKLFRWSGYSPERSAWLGCGYSFVFQSTIEVFDGFSTGWGASTGDIAANIVGTGGFLAQELLWEEQRIKMKFSFRESPYPTYRPDLLGTSFGEHIFKDYNGQTYWLSVNLASFTKSETWIPEWLNIAIGYGIDGFISGSPDDDLSNFPKNLENFPRMRLFYLSPDIDLEKIETKNKVLKTTFSILNNFKVPLPAVGLSQSGNFEFLWFGF